jgi:hypothetical protein
MLIRSVSFDTSFLLRNSILVDKVIKQLAQDHVPCFLPSTVVSELEQLKVWGRISPSEYHDASKRWKRVHASVIDFKNRLLSDDFGRRCMESMEKIHGVKSDDIRNDCSILVSALKNGVDLFLSEDFHFTSKITKEVIEKLSNAACTEYHLMCGSTLFSINAETFLAAYNRGDVDLAVVELRGKNIQKPGKRFEW